MWFKYRGLFLLLMYIGVFFFEFFSKQQMSLSLFIYLTLALIPRIFAGLTMGNHSNQNTLDAPILVREGIYTFSRNPLYLSNILVSLVLIGMSTGLPWYTKGSLIFLVYLVTMQIIHQEESFLRKKWGELYLEYLKETSRWWSISKSWQKAKEMFSTVFSILGYSKLPPQIEVGNNTDGGFPKKRIGAQLNVLKLVHTQGVNLFKTYVAAGLLVWISSIQ